MAPVVRERDPGALAIPADWSEISPTWMTAALQESFPGARVAEVRLATRDDGTNRRARLGLEYSAGTGPETVFLKAEGEHRLLHQRNGNLFNEAELFASGAPLHVDHPSSYRVLLDRPGLDWLIVMEDVTGRDGDPRDSTRPMTAEQVAGGVRGLARLHGAYWDYSAAELPQLGWVQPWAPTEGFASGLRRRIPLGLERAGGALPGSVASMGADGIVAAWARFVTSLAQGATTLLHGDAHIGNTYVLPDDDVGFLDWQVVRRGNWSQDVGYFAQGSLTTDDRDDREAELVDEYRLALPLSDAGRPSAEDAWVRYRASAAYGLAVWLSTLGTDGFQSREVSLTLVERYAEAFCHLRSLEALDRLGV